MWGGVEVVLKSVPRGDVYKKPRNNFWAWLRGTRNTRAALQATPKMDAAPSPAAPVEPASHASKRRDLEQKRLELVARRAVAVSASPAVAVDEPPPDAALSPSIDEPVEKARRPSSVTHFAALRDNTLGAAPFSGRELAKVADKVNEDAAIEAALGHAPLNYQDHHSANEREVAFRALSQPAIIRRDMGLVRRRLKQGKFGLLNPYGTGVQILELLNIIALGVTVYFTPYEICFLSHEPETLNRLALNWGMTGTFTVGIVVQFFLPYRLSSKEGGAKVKSHFKIAKNYLSTWFFIDVASTIPYDTVVEVVLGATSGGGDGGFGQQLKLLRLLRILRLVKLAKVMKSNKVFASLAERLESVIVLSFATKTLIWWTILMLTLIHWFCCVWGLVAMLHGTQRTSALTNSIAADCDIGFDDCLADCELATLATMRGEHELQTRRHENWVCRARMEYLLRPSSATSTDIYLYVLHTSGFIEPTIWFEHFIYFMLSFVMLVVSNIFVGVIAGVQAENDPQGKAYKSNCDRLDHFLREVKAPTALRRRTREHLRLSRELVARQSFADLLDFFPPKLRGAVNAHVGGATLRAVPYLRACEPEFIQSLSERLVHAGFEAREQIPYDGPAIHFVLRGTAVRGGHPIAGGQYWGDDAIISSNVLRNARPAVALTYCETATVTREDIQECLEGCEESERVIRRHAMVMTMHRATQIIARHAVAMRERPSRVLAVLKDVGGHNTSDSAAATDAVDAGAGVVAGAAIADPHHDKALRALVKKLNGNVELRGRAAEHISSRDATVAAAAKRMESLGEPDALIDEKGAVVSRAGELLPPPVEPTEHETLMRVVLQMRDEIRSELHGEALRGVIREELQALGHGHKHGRRPLAAGTRSGSSKSAPRDHRDRRSAGQARPKDEEAAAAEQNEALSPRTEAAMYEA